jgi:hypothetical protein
MIHGAVAIKRAIEPEIKKDVRRGRPKIGGKLPPLTGKSRERVATFIGKKARSLAKAEAIVAAAEAEPEAERIAKLVEDMDWAGYVSGGRICVYRSSIMIEKVTGNASAKIRDKNAGPSLPTRQSRQAEGRAAHDHARS